MARYIWGISRIISISQTVDNKNDELTMEQTRGKFSHSDKRIHEHFNTHKLHHNAHLNKWATKFNDDNNNHPPHVR